MNLVVAISLFVSGLTSSPGLPKSTAEKILVLRIDASGFVTDGFSTIGSDDLANYVRERLFKTFLSTGKMYDRILLQKTGEPPELAMEVILKEIKLGQQEAMNEFCLHRYKKLFSGLEGRQQEKIKKQFPVLFQTEYFTQ